MASQEVELVLCRQLASYLDIPMWIMGADGRLVYFNKAAEPFLGRTFEEAGELPIDDLASVFETTTVDGSPLQTSELPLAIALRERRPAHLRFRGKALDGNWWTVDTTAIPLEGQGGRLVGALAVFWLADSD